MKTITIVGAGFSGLTLAFELVQRGRKVEIVERNEEPGGLIGTFSTPHGLVESAANAIMANKEVEELFEQLELPFARIKETRSQRYIFWEEPKRWPLTPGTSWKVGLNALCFLLGWKSEVVMPRAGESIAEWGERFGGEEFVERLLAPALQGIYAGDPERLSAVLVLQTLIGEKPPKGELKGSVAPVHGMGSLIQTLTQFLKKAGVTFYYDTRFKMPNLIDGPLVLSTAAWHAAEILKPVRPELGSQLEKCESLPMVSATCFFDKSADDLKGFGCLFPESQGFAALGVLFNNCIFGDRSKRRSETWIFGGAKDLECVALADDLLLNKILDDREKLLGVRRQPASYKVSRWLRGIPHYTTSWEKVLAQLKVDPPLYLHGNYLGEIGLARIYSRSRRLADEIKEAHG